MTMDLQDLSADRCDCGCQTVIVEQETDWDLRQRAGTVNHAPFANGMDRLNQAVTDRLEALDHTMEDLMTDQDDDALDAAEGEGRR